MSKRPKTISNLNDFGKHFYRLGRLWLGRTDWADHRAYLDLYNTTYEVVEETWSLSLLNTLDCWVHNIVEEFPHSDYAPALVRFVERYR
jgi:hypothetical protein